MQILPPHSFTGEGILSLTPNSGGGLLPRTMSAEMHHPPGVYYELFYNVYRNELELPPNVIAALLVQAARHDNSHEL